MALDATARRRWLGATALLAALAMVVAGETFLPGHLGPGGFLVFWLVCLGFTMVAIFVAVLDFRSIQRKIVNEQRNFVQSTLNEIASDVRRKPRPPESNGNP